MRIGNHLFRTALTSVITLAVLSVLPSQMLAQGADVIRGRILAADSTPVEGAMVTVTSVITSVARNTRTDKNGRYTIVFASADGHYIVSVSQIGYVLRTFELKRLADEDILVADATLQKIQLETVVVSADVRGTIPRNSTSPDVTGTEQLINSASLLPDQIGDLLAMAASIPGVTMVPGADGGPGGFSVLGLDPGDNTVTMNGMTFDTGMLPADAGLNSSLNTSPYDVSRGGFSGANLNVRPGGGSNYVTQGMTLNLQIPQLQWTDRASQATGNESTNLRLDGMFAGPIKLNSSFYRVAYGITRNSSPLHTLLNTNSLGLRSTGVSSDSVGRMIDLLNSYSIPTTAGGSPRRTLNENYSFSGNFTLQPLTSSVGASYSLFVNGGYGRNSPTGVGASSLLSSSGESEQTNFGLQASHTAYLKIFLSETSVGINASSRASSPYLELPSGRVRINSEFDDGTTSVRTLSFGGGGTRSNNSNNSAQLTNNLSWFSTNNKHRLRLTTSLQYQTSHEESSGNLLGTYTYNSLTDFESGVPASFSRQLNERRANSGQIVGSMSLGDSYRVNPDFQLQYGIRADGGANLRKPEHNPAITQAFNIRNDFVPTGVAISPRIGFSWTLGSNPALSAFEGAVRGPRAVVRGGVGIYANNPVSGSVNSVINNTGLPGSIQTLNCVGPATPLANWSAYVSDPELVPAECADGTGGTVFSNSSPSVTVFARDFQTPRSIRSELSWRGPILDNRFNLNVSGTHSLNLNRQSTVDLNFDPTVRFTLPDEGDRPVYVNATSIVSNTGSIASRDARLSQNFSRVSELRSDLRSETARIQLSLNPVIRSSTALRWGLTYTFQDIREQQRGFSSTVSNPQEVYWSRGTTGSQHQISYNLNYNFFGWVRVAWNGSFSSGRPFTPSISGDVNGDGYSNDRAFIFDPATTADPELASAMEQLLNNASPRARECLNRQLGRFAGRNSCVGPWTMNGGLSIVLDPVKFRMPNRAQVQFGFSNPLGAADLLFNGSDALQGWGQNVSIDPTLLYVRGFDPQTQRFKYEVNERFGSPRQSLRTLSSPVVVSASVKMDIGPTRERQTLIRNLERGRTVEGTKYPQSSLRSSGVTSIPNAITSIMRLQDSLQLSAVQADSIATLNRKYSIRLDSLWAVAAEYLYNMPDDFNPGDAYARYMQARRAGVDLMLTIAPLVKGILTKEQMRKLPGSTLNALDPRYLALVKSGNGLYVQSGAAGLGGVLGEAVLMSGGSMVIVR